MTLFAALVIQRELLTWATLPRGLADWVLVTGSLAALAFLVYWLAFTFKTLSRRSSWGPLFFLCFTAVTLLWFGLLFGLLVCLIAYAVSTAIPREWKPLRTPALNGVWLALFVPATLLYLVPAIFLWYALVVYMRPNVLYGALFGTTFAVDIGYIHPNLRYALTAGAGCALLAAVLPLLESLVLSMRLARIWAIARLSIKEAIRSRVVLVFGFMALVFLFADWFVPFKAEDQVRNYVRVVFWSMTPLFLLTASLVGALSIPGDLKSQAIQTIVTKPVEKFEIVLGRFVGYGCLLTVGLAALSLLSLGYVVRGVNQAASFESLKARMPVFGKLQFVGTANPEKGESVGREWNYRGYIAGPNFGHKDSPRQYAVWTFDDVPGALADRDGPATFEFTFDIFRLSKGEENKDIPCTFTFADGALTFAEVNDRFVKIQDERAKRSADTPPEVFANELIERHGVHVAAGTAVTDNHTQDVKVPVAFFKKLLAAPRESGVPPMQVIVSVDYGRETQMVGMARRDLYLLAGEGSFWVNFLKGAVGLWCTLMLVLGVALAASTHLSGIIAWLGTCFLYVAGNCTEYLQQLAANQVPGGGPAESFYRVTLGKVQAAEIGSSPTASVLRGTDQVFSLTIRRLLNLVPDLDRFDLHPYVANGFDVAVVNVLLVDNLIPLVGYLVPWAILAYYLMRFREIANPT